MQEIPQCPNVKRLNVLYRDVKRIVSCDFGCLHKLEALVCRFVDDDPRRVGFLQNLTFPSSLQELFLYSNCCKDLSVIGSLPNLRSLLLVRHPFRGSEWNPVVGGFLGLKVLVITQVHDLINWNAESSHFPVLEKLILQRLPNLNEIPSDLGEISTLAEIYVHNCSQSASISTVKILDEQESLGNDGLQAQISFEYKDEIQKFKKKIKQFNSSRSSNLQLKMGCSVLY